MKLEINLKNHQFNQLTGMCKLRQLTIEELVTQYIMTGINADLKFLDSEENARYSAIQHVEEHEE